MMILWTMSLDKPIIWSGLWDYSYVVVPQTAKTLKMYREHINGYGGWC